MRAPVAIRRRTLYLWKDLVEQVLKSRVQQGIDLGVGLRDRHARPQAAEDLAMERIGNRVHVAIWFDDGAVEGGGNTDIRAGFDRQAVECLGRDSNDGEWMPAQSDAAAQNRG